MNRKPQLELLALADKAVRLEEGTSAQVEAEQAFFAAAHAHGLAAALPAFPRKSGAVESIAFALNHLGIPFTHLVEDEGSACPTNRILPPEPK